MSDITKKWMRNPTFGRRLGFIFIDVIVQYLFRYCAAIPVHQFTEGNESSRTKLQQQKCWKYQLKYGVHFWKFSLKNKI
jgi:hypothetical protein